MNVMDVDNLDDALKVFIQLTNMIDTGNQKRKEITSKKKEVKQKIIDMMKIKNLEFLHIDDIYLKLIRKVSKPKLDQDIITQAYIQFHTTNSFENTNVDTISKQFAQFVFEFINRLSTETCDLKVSKKKPVSLMIHESLYSKNMS